MELRARLAVPGDEPGPDVTSERWQQIKPILASALERPANERAALLVEVCASDAALRAEVESLIAAHDAAGTFIDVPALLEPLVHKSAATGVDAANEAAIREEIGRCDVELARLAVKPRPGGGP